MPKGWKLRHWLLLGALALGVPSTGWAYVVCTQVVNVYPDGTETHCQDCNLYTSAGVWTGEITDCTDDDPRKGPV
jgi:hypothetical protein